MVSSPLSFSALITRSKALAVSCTAARAVFGSSFETVCGAAAEVEFCIATRSSMLGSKSHAVPACVSRRPCRGNRPAEAARLCHFHAAETARLCTSFHVTPERPAPRPALQPRPQRSCRRASQRRRTTMYRRGSVPQIDRRQETLQEWNGAKSDYNPRRPDRCRRPVPKSETALLTELFTAHQFWVGLPLIIGTNLVLSGDNAVVIALAASSLPRHQQGKAIMWGSLAAAVLLIILTIVAVTILQWPFLKVIGGLMLLWVGVQLVAGEDEE